MTTKDLNKRGALTVHKAMVKKTKWGMHMLLILAGFTVLNLSCSKVEYTQIEQPAYLRVFNNLNYKVSMDVKDGKVPYFCMLINPEVNGAGKPVGAEIIGDFLDIRNAYAPPYPSHVGANNSVNNPEYPGKENVLVGPIVNGYDLSSWAQVPSGSIRVMFVYRPKNTISYFDLEPVLQGDVLLDTTINLQPSEVYTMHLLQKDFKKRENGILLRQENFHKQAFSDSLMYMNFYNYSATGFQDADASLKPDYAPFKQGIRDKMNIFLTLYPNETSALNGDSFQHTAIPGYKGKFLTTLEQDITSNAPKPYVSFPLWANPTDDGIRTKSWQYIDFFAPGLSPSNNPYSFTRNQEWESVAFLSNGSSIPQYAYASLALPNMLINIHSGIYNPRSFATINTIEIVNGYAYLTTIQRKYEAPRY